MPEFLEFERKLAAVLAADVARYSNMTEADEIGTVRMLVEQRAILDSAIARHRGRIANTAGDSVLAEFPSAVNAVRCAVEAQQALRDAVKEKDEDRRVLFRIGIHVGDVMVREGDLLGSGVNIAARLEALAEPGGIVLSAAAHELVRKILPLVYTDLGAQSVKNIEEPVQAFAVVTDQTQALPQEVKQQLSLPSKPSIAVLPFQNMSGDPEQEYFADGMVDDIITALCRRKGLFVIARNSSFFYKGKQFDVRQVGRELGVRYILEGSVRRASGNVRITGQLIDATNGTHLWADRFDGAIDDVFELQDRITVNVIGAIAPEIERAEIERAQRKPTSDLAAYDHYLRGSAAYYRWTHEGAIESQAHLKIAVRLDPTYARAWAQLANWYTTAKINSWIEANDLEVRDAIAFARRALTNDKGDPEVLARCGWTLHYIGRLSDEGFALMEAATELDPNFAMGWTWLGLARSHLGDHYAAMECFKSAIRISPRDIWRHQTAIGWAFAYFFTGQYEKARLSVEEALRTQPTHMGMRRLAIASNAMAGRLDEAKLALARAISLDPDTSISKFRRIAPWRRDEDRDHMIEGFRRAGLSE